MRTGHPCTIILVACLLAVCSVPRTQADLETFDVSGFSNVEEILLQIDANSPFTPIMKGYPLWDWRNEKTVISALQGDVEDETDLQGEFESYLPISDDTVVGDHDLSLNSVEVQED